MKIKDKVLTACFAYAHKRIENFKIEIDIIKESIESNDKGGDEDDSGNGKLFNDLEKNAAHLWEAQKTLESLKAISPKRVSDIVTLGSLVKTTSHNFFISISAGKIEVDNLLVFAISPSSPIALLLLNKSKGESIHFNGKTFTITEII